VTSINIALTLALDNGFVAMVSPAQSAVHSVLTTRLILNLREAASRRFDDFSVDLHLSDTDSRGACRSQIRFAENPAGLNHDGGHKNDTSQHRIGLDSAASTTRIGMVSISTSTTVSHVTLPMTRDTRGKRVVGRPEPDPNDGEEDDMDSIRAPEEWV